MDYSVEEIKIKINMLLWQILPAETPLGQAEKIACEMFKALQDNCIQFKE